MNVERFAASRWTRGNLLFPTVIEVTDAAVVRRKRSWFTKNEMSIHLQRVASVHVETGFFWSDVLIETAQTQHLQAGADDGPTKVCPFCAESVKLAAKVCRFCGRELPLQAGRE